MSEIASRVAELSKRVEDLKVPPHSMEAEQSVLGGLMLDNEAWETVADLVNEQDFYRHDHALIFRAIADLSNQSKPYDVVTISDWLDQRNELDNIGGLAYLGILANDTPTAVNVKAYASIVREYSVLRNLIQVGHDIANSAYNADGRTSKELVDEAERRVFQIAEQGAGQRQGFEDIKSLLTKAVEKVEELYKSDEALTGISSGFSRFDEMTSGLQNSDLIIIAGRPSMGKCIVSGSLLADPESGALRSIDDLVKSESAQVTSVSEQFKLVTARASRFVDDGIKPVFKVVTALGREIETTLTHPFLTGSGWQALEHIREGEKIAVPRILRVFGRARLPEYQVKALAYFLTDGGVTQTSPLFTNTNQRIVDDFIQAVSAFPGISVQAVAARDRAPSFRVSARNPHSQSLRQRFADALNQALHRLRLSGKQLAAVLHLQTSTVSQWRNAHAVPSPANYDALCDSLDGGFIRSTEDLFQAASCKRNAVTGFLQDYGVWGKSAPEKILPGEVFTLEQDQIALLLNRMFACDGGVSITKHQQVRISYATASRQLARQIQHLLLRFGILGKLRTKSSYTRPQFEVEIMDAESLANFIRKIGIHGKEARLQATSKIQSAKNQHSNLDSVPDTVIDYILNLKGTRNWKQIFSATGLHCPSGYNPHLVGASKRHLSRNKLRFFAELFADSYLENLANSDLYWDSIVSIEYQGYKQVYDLTIPDHHNFIAQDICVHNTTFAMNLAENAAVSGERSVGVFSMEMPGEQLAMRMMSSLGRIDQHNLRTGNLQEQDWPRLTSSVAMLSKARLFIDDTPALSPTELRARTRRLKREHGLDLVIIDYLQLMQIGGNSENRATEIAEISRNLKALAKELNVPIIALSQLNRSVEQRPDKRPVMSDLRESGGIEQDADVILFIYRDEVYNPDSADKGTAEILIRKQRNGPIGTVKLAFLGKFTRFENLSYEDYGLDE